MAPKRDTDAVGIAEREIIALPDIVEAVELDHHVMDHVGAALDKGDAVVAGIDVKEISREWPQPVVAELEAKDIRIKRHHLGDALEMHHHVTHAEGPGTEAGNIATGLERLACSLGAVKSFKPVAGGIVEYNQVCDMPLAGERPRAARDPGAGGFEPTRERSERRCVRHLPAEEADALAAVGIDHESLFAVIHTERKGRAALVDALQAEEVAAVACPVVQIPGANADIA